MNIIRLVSTVTAITAVAAANALTMTVPFNAGGTSVSQFNVAGATLNGITIDYTSNMMGSGFTFENPNATGGCGCGTSFSA